MPKKKKSKVDHFIDDLLEECRKKDPSPRGPISGGELMRRLESDPEWVRKRDEREAERERRHQEYLKIEKPVVDDLRAAGCEVESVWDLVNSTPDTYEFAVPVLVRHLSDESYIDKVRESCARALTKKLASDAFEDILAIFETMPNTGPNKAKWATANALGVMMNRKRLHIALEIIADPNHDVSCKNILYYNIKRYKLPSDKRAEIEDMLAAIDWEVEGY